VGEFIRDLDAPSPSPFARRPRTADWSPISKTLLPGLEGRCDEGDERRQTRSEGPEHASSGDVVGLHREEARTPGVTEEELRCGAM
jgi:hypothetical protein